MDMRTVEKIEYGSASAVRVPPDAISNLGMLDRFIAFDTETTGLNPDKDCIVELGAVVFEHGVPIETFQSYVNPGVCISEEVSALNHITNEMLQAAPTEEIIYPELMRFLGTAAKGETMICGHVAAFARKTFGMYGGEDRKITLEGENHLVGVVIDRFGTDVMIHPHDEEYFHAGVTVTVSPQFFGWLAGIGKGIRISWPEDVREEYKQYLQGIVESL